MALKEKLFGRIGMAMGLRAFGHVGMAMDAKLFRQIELVTCEPPNDHNAWQVLATKVLMRAAGAAGDLRPDSRPMHLAIIYYPGDGAVREFMSTI